MQLHELKRHTTNKKSARVGRGGKRGKTSGRGTKGQKARAGRKMRPELRDIIKKIPKRRGYRFKGVSTAAFPVSLDLLEKSFASGDSVTREALLEKKVIAQKGSKYPQIKILARGEITKKLTITGLSVSGAAKEKILKAGGTVA